MSPQQRTEINRANATHSTGPKTEPGKQAVSGNAVKTGLTSKVHLLLPGEEEAFARHLAGYRETYEPKNTPEEDLVRTLAQNYWRLNRAHNLEEALFLRILDSEAAEGLHPTVAQAEAWLDPAKGLKNLATYAARIQRAIEKTTAELKSMQSERKAAYAKAEEEAILLTQLAYAKGNTAEAATHFPPGGNYGGFVYSVEDIARKVTRRTRLLEARMRYSLESSPEVSSGDRS